MPQSKSLKITARITLEEKHQNLQAALDKWKATQSATNPISINQLALKDNVPRSTLQGTINGRPTKLESCAKRGLLTAEEEEVLVRYLLEAAQQGFPDTRRQLLLHVSEIVQLKAPEWTIEVNKNWSDNFLHRHHDHLARYWLTSLTTVCGGAANRDTVDAWFNLLEEMVQQYNICPETLFNMDETSVAFG